jgi:hypothetical protein
VSPKIILTDDKINQFWDCMESMNESERWCKAIMTAKQIGKGLILSLLHCQKCNMIGRVSMLVTADTKNIKAVSVKLVCEKSSVGKASFLASSVGANGRIR